MKYYVVAALAIILNAVAVWFLTPVLVPVMTFWPYVILSMLWAFVLGRAIGLAVWEWRLRDALKDRDKLYDELFGP